jgi:hypothetical protein
MPQIDLRSPRPSASADAQQPARAPLHAGTGATDRPSIVPLVDELSGVAATVVMSSVTSADRWQGQVGRASAMRRRLQSRA